MKPDILSGFTFGDDIQPPGARAQRLSAQLQLKVPPGTQFERVCAGYGTLASCDGCNDAIEADEIEYELRFRRGAETLTIRLHRECWESWRDE